MDEPQPIRLSTQGLFLVLGKICYAMELLQSKFEDEEEAPVGVETALEELEVAREPLLQLLLQPVDLRDAFTAYMQSEYELSMNLDFAVPPVSGDPDFTDGSVMSIVRT